ncbi:hypothetical protein ACFS07_34375 [Undibacterium arcticum]
MILALEVGDLWGLINRIADIPGRPGSRVAKPDAKVLSISANYLYQKNRITAMSNVITPPISQSAPTRRPRCHH